MIGDIIGHFVQFLRGQTINQLRRSGAIIGSNVNLLSATIDRGTACLVEIGNNVTITGATVLAHDASTKIPLGYTKIAKTKIGDNVFIGTGSIINAGSKIGNDVIIGSGSVIRGDIPSNSVVVGNPGNVICSYDEYINKNKFRFEKSYKCNRAIGLMTTDEKRRICNILGDNIGFEP